MSTHPRLNPPRALIASFACASAIVVGVASVAYGQASPPPGASSAVSSPSLAPPAPDPMAPSFFTGNAPVTGACAIAGPTDQVVDGVRQMLGAAWGCLTWTTDDPRFSGISRDVYDQYQYLADAGTATGRLGTVTAGRNGFSTTKAPGRAPGPSSAWRDSTNWPAGSRARGPTRASRPTS